MISRFYFCPHCSTKLEKGAAMLTFAEMESKGAEYFAFGSKKTPCSVCGGSMDNKHILNGAYDLPPVIVYWKYACFYGGWIIGTIVSMAVFGFGFWPALGIGFGVGIAASMVVILVGGLIYGFPTQ
jgi:hypothetical protein